jgi:hypothetical protein
MSRLIVGVVDSVSFTRKPNEHTVAYDEAGRAVEGRSNDFWKSNIGAVSGEWKHVHDTLKVKIQYYLQTVLRLSPKDFDFKVKFSDLSLDGSFYPFFTGSGDNVYFQ